MRRHAFRFAGRRCQALLVLTSLLIGGAASSSSAELGASIHNLAANPLLQRSLGGLARQTPCRDTAPPAGVHGYTLTCLRSTKWEGVTVYAYADSDRRVAAQSMRIITGRFAGTRDDMLGALLAFADEATARSGKLPRFSVMVARALGTRRAIKYIDGRYLIEIRPVDVLSLTISWSSLPNR